MSGVAVIRYLMSQNAALIAVVPAAKIIAGVIPLSTVLPAIAVQQITGQERLTVSMNEASRMRTERVQVTVQAKTYPTQKSILELVRTACLNRNGTVNGIDLDSILPDVQGPDFQDVDAVIYMQSQDFIVKFRI